MNSSNAPSTGKSGKRPGQGCIYRHRIVVPKNYIFAPEHGPQFDVRLNPGHACTKARARVLAFTLLNAFLLSLILHSQVAAQGSLYQDNRARSVGDIVTILLMENISGSSTTDAKTSSRTDAGGSAGMEGNFIAFQPYFGANSSVNYNADDRASANQRQLLQGSMSAVVEEVLPNGILLINGERFTEINGELHRMRVRGMIRSIDIDNYNRIPSFRVADAQIDYQKKDGFGPSKRRPGFLRRALWAGLGLGVAAVVISREVQR